MGQKVNPTSMRTQVSKNWRSRWFTSNRKFAEALKQDMDARAVIEDKFLNQAVVNEIIIERSHKSVNLTIYTPKPGVVIGRGGSGVEELKLKLNKIYNSPVRIGVEEIKRPELYAKIVGEGIARQLRARGSFRRAMNFAAAAAMRSGAKGIKIQVAGRLGGAEMARTERVSEGSVPLHTIRANIDYAQVKFLMPGIGIIGIKVWINKGEN